MAPDQSLDVDRRVGCFRLVGELVGDSALSTLERVRRFAATTDVATIDLDLTDVTFMDSVGLRELLILKGSLPTLRVVAVSSRLRRTFALTGTTELLLSQDAEGPPPPER